MKLGVAGSMWLAVVMAAGAAEYGRGDLSDSGALGRAALPKASDDAFFGGGTWGVKAGIGWAMANWELGDAEGSDGVFAPHGSFFYKATDNVDFNVSALFLTAEDSDGDFGDNEADMVRLALGVRYWFDLGNRFVPYLGAGVGYYLVDGSTENVRENGVYVPAGDVSVDNAPGAFLEGGVAFQVSDNFFLNAEASYDFLLGSADAEINGEEEDFGVSAFVLGVGATLMF